MADKQFFKRYRMEIRLEEAPVPFPVLPDGYVWREWNESDVERHALTKFRSFRDELDAEVFSCLGEYYGCLRLMTDIAQQESFLGPATWLVSCADNGEIPQDCGTIQGLASIPESGAIQNVGIVPQHRGQGLGRALVQAALCGFRDSGLTTVSLEVTAANVPAVKLYQSLGFLITKTLYRTVE